MKKILCIWFVLAFAVCNVFSQERLSRNVLATLDPNELVKPGEFQMELAKAEFFNDDADHPWFSFVYTTVNKFTGISNIVANGSQKIINREMSIRPYRIGPTFQDCIVVLKNIGATNNQMGHGMEFVTAYGISNPVCDSIMYLNDDGYVFMLRGACYYSQYKTSYDNQATNEPVVWLNRKLYNKDLKFEDKNKADAFARLSNDDVYFESSEGHYYYLYRDKYMPNSVLVVDNTVVELFDVYNEDKLKFQFSYNGQHWMAVGKECFWVDGTLKSIEGYGISDFLITNDGHYAYCAYEKGNASQGVVVVFDGHIIRRNADVCYFGLTAEGRLKIRFVSNDRYLQYEKEKISDVTNALTSVYYPDEDGSRTVTVSSSDGAHKLTYVQGEPSVEIDGAHVADSEPCYAIFDSKNNAFVWNAIETSEAKTELVIYKYVVGKKLFKKVFK